MIFSSNKKLYQLHLKGYIIQGFFQTFFTAVPKFQNSKIEFPNSILIIYHFTNSYFIGIVEILFLIARPLEKDFKEKYVFSAFYSRSVFSSNLVGFKLQNFYSLSLAIVRLL